MLATDQLSRQAHCSAKMLSTMPPTSAGAHLAHQIELLFKLVLCCRAWQSRRLHRRCPNCRCAAWLDERGLCAVPAPLHGIRFARGPERFPSATTSNQGNNDQPDRRSAQIDRSRPTSYEPVAWRRCRRRTRPLAVASMQLLILQQQRAPACSDPRCNGPVWQSIAQGALQIAMAVN